MSLRSSILSGTLRHRRSEPFEHAFTYRVWHALVDLDELPRLDADVIGFGWNRPAPLGLRDTDHLGGVDLPIRVKLSRWLAAQGMTLPDGPVLLQSNLRVAGYVFDPVSWLWCHDAAGGLALVVAEVRNTFGDVHCYVLDDLEGDPGKRVTARASKVFHVSPFLPIAPLRYRFAFRPPTLDTVTGARVAVHMDVLDDEQRVFDATLVEQPEPLTTGALWRAVGRVPHVTAMTTAAIHTQALRLWRRGARFHRRPDPPDTGFDAIAEPQDPTPAPRLPSAA